MTSRWRRLFGFLRISGNIAVWHVYLAAAAAVWCIYCRIVAQKTLTPYALLAVLPVAVGTGILTSGRTGRFDLLIGSGVSRRRLYWSAALFALGPTACLSLCVFIAADVLTSASSAVRLILIILFTCGVSFAVGVVELRHAGPILWLLGRFLFFVSPNGVDILRTLERGATLPSPATLILTTVAVPETALSPNLPLAYAAAGAAAGVAALLCALRVFSRSDLPGKRT